MAGTPKTTTRKRQTRRSARDTTLAPGRGGRTLDKILLLEQVIGRDDVLQALHAAGCLDARRCPLTFEVTCWVVLALGLLTELPIRQVFKACRRLYPGDWDPGRSALCKARQRLGVGPVRLLLERLARPLASPDTPGAFYAGLRLVALDGTVLTVPDSDDNARAFGYPDGGRGRGAFPQVRKLSLVEVGTHAELAFAVKGVRKGSAERSMTPGLFRHLQAGMLLVWDRGFFGYKLWQGLIPRGCQVLARVSGRLVLRPVRGLADGSYLAKIYPCESFRNRDEGGLLVRVIRYTHDDPRVGRGQEHTLLTTLQDATAHPAKELAVLYHERWEIELTFDEQKTHQNPKRPTKPQNLRSQTPVGVIQEVYALSIGHYVVRSMMAEAASRDGVDPDRLSFTGCLQVLRTRLGECPAEAAARAEWCGLFFAELGRERVPARRNRVNPRVVRVKMSKFKKKRPEHRGIRPLDRPFADAIIVQHVAPP